MSHDVLLRIIRVLPFTGDTSWRHSGVNYPYHTLYFVLEGDGHVRTADGVTDLLPGHVYLIPQQVEHDIWCDSHIRKMYADVHLELFPGFDVLSGVKQVCSLQVGQDVCQQLYNASFEDSIRSRTWLRGQLLAVLASFMPEESVMITPQMQAFMPIIEEIQQHLSASIRREDIARRYGWSPSSLSRAFRKAFQCSLKHYIERMLIARLAEELLLTDKTLQTLAAEFDFCDAYYLSSFFKRAVGISPSAYRKLHAGGHAASPTEVNRAIRMDSSIPAQPAGHDIK